MSKIIDRTGKGSNISQAENDSNLDSLHGINQAIAGLTHTVTIADQGDTLEFTNGGAVAVTLDSIATIAAAAHTSDFHVTLIAIGTGTVVTITPDALNTINTGVSTIVLAENEYVTIETDSTNLIWNIIGFNRLDGLKGSQFLRSDANDTATGDLTLSGAIDLTGTLEIGGVQVTSTAAELNILDGVTANAAEINALDNSSKVRANYAGGGATTNNAITILPFDTEDFDTRTEFTTGAASRFTADQAGYYSVSASFGISINPAVGDRLVLLIYKNAGQYAVSEFEWNNTNTRLQSILVDDLVYLNGSTDYIDIRYYIITSASPSFGAATSNKVAINRVP